MPIIPNVRKQIEDALAGFPVNDKYVNDLIGNKPSAAAYGIGWYFARDDTGGKLYFSDGVTWTPITKGLNWASGTQLGYGPEPALTFDAKGAGTTFTDISPNCYVTIPASAVPVKLSGKVYGQSKTGTAAAAAVATLQLQLCDTATPTPTQLDVDALTVIQVTAATVTWGRSLKVEVVLPAPVAAGTYKLQGRIASAAPANWGTIQLLSGGIFPPNAWILAEAM